MPGPVALPAETNARRWRTRGTQLNFRDSLFKVIYSSSTGADGWRSYLPNVQGRMQLAGAEGTESALILACKLCPRDRKEEAEWQLFTRTIACSASRKAKRWSSQQRASGGGGGETHSHLWDDSSTCNAKVPKWVLCLAWRWRRVMLRHFINRWDSASRWHRRPIRAAKPSYVHTHAGSLAAAWRPTQERGDGSAFNYDHKQEDLSWKHLQSI